ncbi:MAG: ammonia-forming cytochrome c nitrite reductase subunit c552, partial [Planctomycetota bacterium]|nr:ammonia-forming cytochrome c nitrite reductase subunit c552 [Planctomycetota bacterium]
VAAAGQAHTHHAADSPGSSCMNCHMPHTTWGLFTAMRSHRIDSPSAATSAATGRPNACNQCHVDRPLGWTAEHLTAWYGQDPVTDMAAEHRDVAASIVWALRGDAAQRAIAAWSLGWEPARRASGSGWQGSYLAMLLSDPYASVRKAAYDALRQMPGFRDGDFTYDFVPGEAEQRGSSGRAMQIWGGTRGTFLDRRGTSVLIDDRGEPMQQRIMDLYRQRDDTPVRIIE